jgi:class 3 adenylate cyclase
VLETPRTEYVTVDDADVAYQVVGNGAIDVVYFYGIGAHVELFWEAPYAPAFLRRLASFSRLVLFNRRGTGASDGVPRNAIPTWEGWTEDLAAVLDAAESTQAVLFATMDAGPIAMLFAAMHPDRVGALVLLTTTARYLSAEDYSIGVSEETAAAVVRTVEELWGTPELLGLANPSMADDRAFLEFGAKWFRASATPHTAAAQFDYMLRNLDVRHVLPLIQAPTLVMHARDNAIIPVEHGRYLAAHIKGARLIELDSGDTAITPTNYLVADEISEFLTGQRVSQEVDRVFSTVLFTDIVGSTELAARLGDSEWRSLLDMHDRAIRSALTAHRGREINTTGDGFVASFDGPARAIRCATELLADTGHLGLEIRVGLHSGECWIRGSDLSGLAVHIAARIGAIASAGEILVSSAVRDLVAGSGIAFHDRGVHRLRGVPRAWELLAVV